MISWNPRRKASVCCWISRPIFAKANNFTYSFLLNSVTSSFRPFSLRSMVFIVPNQSES
jgi:hypothetical protein